MNKKKLIIGGTAAGVILVAAIFGFVFLKGHSSGSSDSGDLVYVDSVTSIMGLGSGTGQLNRFAGVVEPQKTVTIKQSSDKKVKECYVKEGDEVKKGQKLFIYDTSEAEENLSSKEIEIDRIKMDIETIKYCNTSERKSKCVQRRSAGLYCAYPVCPEQPEKERIRAEKHAAGDRAA